MSELHHTIKINAPLDRVWEVLADLEAVRHYNPMVTHARYISSNRTGVGAARQCDLKPKGHVRERVIGWEPKQSITMELYESPWPIAFMRWRPELKPDGSGAVLTQRMEYGLKFGLLGKIMDALMMRRMLDKGIAETLSNLKRFIETGATIK
ncbi:MAG: SRPBCC family protein [Nitrospirae bacterium]|nr:SRPBCC family protein [Nitrospirota bacterium]